MVSVMLSSLLLSMMTRRSLIAFVIAFVVLLPLAVLAKSFDLEYRICARDAMNNRENRIFNDTVNHHQNRLQAFLEHRTRLFEAWSNENDKDRTNTIRFADKDFKNILQFHEKNYKALLRDHENGFRNDEKNCRNAYNDRVKQVPTGAICFSTADCRPPIGICTVDTGECRQSCRPGSNPCELVCSGRYKIR